LLLGRGRILAFKNSEDSGQHRHGKREVISCILSEHEWNQTHESECHFSFGTHQKRLQSPALCVGSALDLAFDVVALAEESEPVVEHLLVLIGQVRPIRTALLRLERRLSESARSVLASEDFEAILLVPRQR
jgi:hypothetical protein